MKLLLYSINESEHYNPLPRDLGFAKHIIWSEFFWFKIPFEWIKNERFLFIMYLCIYLYFNKILPQFCELVKLSTRGLRAKFGYSSKRKVENFWKIAIFW
jgi:hypothetical protein